MSGKSDSAQAKDTPPGPSKAQPNPDKMDSDSDNEDDIVTMSDVVKESTELEEECNAVLGPGDPDVCTYHTQGYAKRQAVFACLTCMAQAKAEAGKGSNGSGSNGSNDGAKEPKLDSEGAGKGSNDRGSNDGPDAKKARLDSGANGSNGSGSIGCNGTEDFYAGFCLACSLKCHEDHKLVELYTKRNFRCDCGNKKFPSANPCKLVCDKADYNPDNSYNHNFEKLYCTCRRPYPSPADDLIEDDMLQCVVCEDWFHGRHVCLPMAKKGSKPGRVEGEMVCVTCSRAHGFLLEYRDWALTWEEIDAQRRDVCNVTEVEAEDPGKKARMAAAERAECRLDYLKKAKAKLLDPSEPKPAKSLKEEEGKPKEGGAAKSSEPEAVKSSEGEATKSSEPEVAKSPNPEGAKASEPEQEEAKSSEPEETKSSKSEEAKSSKPEPAKSSEPEPAKATEPEPKHAQFMKDGWRQALCRCPKCTVLFAEHKLCFLHQKEDTMEHYESLGPVYQSTYEKGIAALSDVKRSEMIQGMEKFSVFKSVLKERLKKFADEDKVVRKEDIEQIMAEVAEQRNKMFK